MTPKEKIRNDALKSARRSGKLLKKEGKVSKQSSTKMNPISRERSTASAKSRRSVKKQ